MEEKNNIEESHSNHLYSQYLPPEEIITLLKTTLNKRNHLLILLLYELGCTLKELVNIRIRDVDFETSQIMITKSSNTFRKERTSRISKKTCNELKEYLSATGTIEKKLSYILTSSHGGHMTVRRVTQIITALLKKAGFSEKANPQVLKYSHIINAYNNNTPIYSIQEQVGLTTQRMIAIILEIGASVIEEGGDSYLDLLNKSLRKNE